MATIRYTFGEEKQYFYEFVIHSKQVNVDITHNTISLSSTNVAYVSTDIIDPFLPGLVNFLAIASLDYSTYVDSFHNYFIPYSQEESVKIVDRVNAAVIAMSNV